MSLEAEREMWDAIAQNALDERSGCDPRVSQHIGKVGETVEVTVMVTGHKYFDGAYNRLVTLVTMQDADNNIYKWFASGMHEYDTDRPLKVRGKVKKHDVWRDQKQTVLTRCKVS